MLKKLRVQMRTNYAGPGGTCEAGKRIELAEGEARELIAGGYAVLPPPEKATGRRGARQATAAAAENAEATGGNKYGGLFSGK